MNPDIFMRRSRCCFRLLFSCAVLIFFNAQNSVNAALQNAKLSSSPISKTLNLVVNTGHSDTVNAITFSPDGTLVATAAEDICLWETSTRRPIRRFRAGSKPVTSLCFSSDGNTLASGSEDGTARLWNVRTGRETHKFKTLPSKDVPPDFEGVVQVNGVALSPDGKQLFVAAGAGSALWEIEKNAVVQRFEGWVCDAAFSADGRKLIYGTLDVRDAATHFDVTLCDVTTLKVLSHQAFEEKQFANLRLQFAPDSKTLLISTGEMRLWDFVADKELWKFPKEKPIGFSADSRAVWTQLKDNQVVSRESSTGKEIETIAANGLGALGSKAWSPDRKQLVAASSNALVSFDVNAKSDAKTQWSRAGFFYRKAGYDSDIVFVSDATQPNRYVWIGNNLWDLENGRIAQRMTEETGYGKRDAHIVAAPDGRWILREGGSGGFLRRVSPDAPPQEFSAQVETGGAGLNVNAFSPDGNWLVTVNDGLHVYKTTLFKDDTSANAPRRATQEKSFPSVEGSIERIAFSLDSRFMAAVLDTNTYESLEPEASAHPVFVVVWDFAARREIARLKVGDKAIGSGVFAWSPNGQTLAIADDSMESKGNIQLWNVANTKMLWKTPLEHPLALAFSGDGKSVVATTYATLDKWQASVKTFDSSTGKSNNSFAINDYVHSIAFLPNGKTLVGATYDGRVFFWDAKSGETICQAVNFGNGKWSVVDAQSRFDSNDLQSNTGLYWVTNDEPLRPLPVSAFEKQFYEPRLLARHLSGEDFSSVPAIGNFNLALPRAEIKSVVAHADDAHQVDVSVEVESQNREVMRDAQKTTQTSGAQTLRLFRDGQIVGEWPQSEEKASFSSTGKAAFTFKNVRLPASYTINSAHNLGDAPIEFSAYAFNSDGVRGDTATFSFKRPATDFGKRGRAFVVSMGVNTYQNSAWDLSYAADDARLTHRVFSSGLVGNAKKWNLLSDYKTISLQLISDNAQMQGGKEVEAVSDNATKANLETVCDLLAGRVVAAKKIAQIPDADKLSRAQPDDIVLLSFAGHGVFQDGEFYLLPSDIGKDAATISPAMLKRCISSRELSQWLFDVDAQIVLVLDACQSAAAIENGGFKPGPANSRGLGQLAYNKKMRILVATQSSDVALENAQVRHGLLSYALLHEGLQNMKAKANRGDADSALEKLTVGEWLHFAVRRVPSLADEARQGKVALTDENGRGMKLSVLKNGKSARRLSQQPSLFSFEDDNSTDIELAARSLIDFSPTK